MKPEPKLKTSEAAEYLRLSLSTLAKMRVAGKGPRYAKAGSRLIVYDRKDLDAWLSVRAVTPANA